MVIGDEALDIMVAWIMDMDTMDQVIMVAGGAVTTSSIIQLW